MYPTEMSFFQNRRFVTELPQPAGVLHSLLLFLILLAADILFTPRALADSPRESLSLDAAWKFHLGDDWPKALRLDKAGANAGPASENLFSDAAWRTVNLPHDWAIELPFDKSADMNHGYRAVGPGFETNSIGWFLRAKFGIRAYGGPQCQPEHGDWYARNMYEEGGGTDKSQTRNTAIPRLTVSGRAEMNFDWWRLQARL
jgi:hypothetical protein